MKRLDTSETEGQMEVLFIVAPFPFTPFPRICATINIPQGIMMKQQPILAINLFLQ